MKDEFIDDTVCTIAVADAIINNIQFDESLRNWCRRYNNAGYGSAFRRWIRLDDSLPFNSRGNDSSMRVSAAGTLANSLEEALKKLKESVEVTHNRPEGIKGDQSTATAIYMAKCNS